MVHVKANIFCRVVLLLDLVSLGVDEIIGVIFTSRHRSGNKQDTEFLENKSGHIADLQKRGIFEKENINDIYYNGDEYKDTIFDFPNSSRSDFNNSKLIVEPPSYEYKEEAEENEEDDVIHLFALEKTNTKATTNKTTVTNTTVNATVSSNETTTTAGATGKKDGRENDYNEKETAYMLRNLLKKDYMETVTYPTATVITISLLILFVLLHLPKFCFGFLYHPPEDEDCKTGVVIEDLHEEHLDEE